jgi:hypothetical protein
MAFMTVARLASLVFLISFAIHAQSLKSPFDPVPADQRPALAQRLRAYTEAFRTKDWAGLYDLVSRDSKISMDGKLKVSKKAFVRDMQGTYDLQRLIKFVPVRTEMGGPGDFSIYGCGKLPYGNEQIERIAAVHAVREEGDWYFANWDYPDPPEPCARLSDPAWKPSRSLRLDGPMSQVSCEVLTCTL